MLEVSVIYVSLVKLPVRLPGRLGRPRAGLAFHLAGVMMREQGFAVPARSSYTALWGDVKYSSAPRGEKTCPRHTWASDQNHSDRVQGAKRTLYGPLSHPSQVGRCVFKTSRKDPFVGDTAISQQEEMSKQKVRKTWEEKYYRKTHFLTLFFNYGSPKNTSKWG